MARDLVVGYDSSVKTTWHWHRWCTGYKRNLTVCALGNTLYGLVQEISAVSILVVQPCCRRSRIGEIGIVGRTGERVSSIRCARHLIVSRNVRHTLACSIVVDLILSPYTLVVVDTHRHQAVSTERLAPFGQLAILQQIILIAVAIIVEDVCLASLFERTHIGNGGLVFELDWIEPA